MILGCNFKHDILRIDITAARTGGVMYNGLFYGYYCDPDMNYKEVSDQYFGRFIPPSEVTLMRMIFDPVLKEWSE